MDGGLSVGATISSILATVVFQVMASSKSDRRRSRWSSDRNSARDVAPDHDDHTHDVVVAYSLRVSSSSSAWSSSGGSSTTTIHVAASSFCIVRLSFLLVFVGYVLIAVPLLLPTLDAYHDEAHIVSITHNLEYPDLMSLQKREWSIADSKQMGGQSQPHPPHRNDLKLHSMLVVNPKVMIQQGISNETGSEEDTQTGKNESPSHDSTRSTSSLHKPESITSTNVIHLNKETNETRGWQKDQRHKASQQQPQQQHQLHHPTETTRVKMVHRGYTSRRKANETHNPHALHAELKDFYAYSTLYPGEQRDGKHVMLDMTKRWNRPNSTLPHWMRDYFNWHDFKRRTWSIDSFNDDRWLIMQCLQSDRKCGGTSDRLKPILYLLRIAYYTKRILLIHWVKPAPLTEFLVPPKGGMDWTVPTWMEGMLLTPTIGGSVDYTEREIRDNARNPQIALVRSKMQEYHGGRIYYDQELVESEPNFETVFSEVWKTFFTPSPAIRQRLEGEMAAMALAPYKYTAAHCRVLYGVDDRPDWIQQSWATNALNCASELRPTNPIFFTSDSATATDHAKRYGESLNATVATRLPTPNPPLHIDFGWRRRPPSDFFDGFVDLYILAQADCVTYNKGGFGILGLLMSRNASCGIRQDALDRPKIQHPCSWMGSNGNQTTPTSSNSTISHKVVASERAIKEQWRNEPFYLEPMKREQTTKK